MSHVSKSRFREDKFYLHTSTQWFRGAGFSQILCQVAVWFEGVLGHIEIIKSYRKSLEGLVIHTFGYDQSILPHRGKNSEQPLTVMGMPWWVRMWGWRYIYMLPCNFAKNPSQSLHIHCMIWRGSRQWKIKIKILLCVGSHRFLKLTSEQKWRSYTTKINAENIPLHIISGSLTRHICTLDNINCCYLFYVLLIKHYIYYIWVPSKNTLNMSPQTLFLS